MNTVRNECACVGCEAVSAGRELGQGTWSLECCVEQMSLEQLKRRVQWS